MKILLIVLNQVKKLDEVVAKLKENGINHGSIIDSNAMSEPDYQEEPTYFKSLRRYLNPERAASKTLIYFVEDAKVEAVRTSLSKIISKEVGDFAFIKAE